MSHTVRNTTIRALMSFAVLMTMAGFYAKPALADTSYEAESSANTLAGGARISSLNGASGGKEVGYLGNGGSLQFNNINVPSTGIYAVTIYYVSGDSTRSLYITPNGGASVYEAFPSTGGWSTLGATSVDLHLNAGNNTILFANSSGYGPDIDRISIATSPLDSGTGAVSGLSNYDTNLGTGNTTTYGAISVTQYPTAEQFSNGIYTITYHNDTGLADYAWNGVTKVVNVYSSLNIGSSYTKSSSYTTHTFSPSTIQSISNAIGTGIEVTITNTSSGKPTINQIFNLYANKNYFTTKEVVQSTSSMSSNYMAPIIVDTPGGVDLGSYTDERVLNVPFDNDKWARFDAAPMNGSGTSYEVSAIYDNSRRNGLVVGSVTHDTWKTGIYWSGSNNRLDKMNVYGGASSNVVGATHDVVPHGSITGTTLQSPTAFVGYYADWRSGMEDYGNANAAINPPLANLGRNIPAGVPVGWNSWAAYGSSLSYQDVIDASNYVKNNLQNTHFNNHGTVYINLDSYWDNLSDAQLKSAVQQIEANGQKAGIYWAPFVYWGNNMSQSVEGTNNQCTYGNIVMRDNSGKILPTLDGAYALDPTNPGTKERIDYFINRFKNAGFSYIKLDFLSHGSLEGKHYDPSVQTGMQAYNEGMQYVDNAIGGTMFISESIAPIFPSQYGDSRRISCDTYGSIDETEYELNSLTYGWWENGTIYHYTDPDHMALSHANSLTEARTRVDSAVISGTVFLDSDNVNDTTAQSYMSTLLTNAAVDQLATKGKAFMPIEGNTATGATNAFVLNDNGTYYLAVFNYNGSKPANVRVDLARAGLDGAQDYVVTDLWTGNVSIAKSTLNFALDPAGSTIVKLQVDNTPPKTTTVTTPASPDGQNGWYVHPVTVTLNATDDLSGVASTVYSLDGVTWYPVIGPIRLSQDSQYNLQFYSTDKVGNHEQPQTLNINVDHTPPTVAITAPTASTYSDDESLAVAYAVYDNLSGVNASSVAPTLDGQKVADGTTVPLYTLTLGTHAFTVSASDNAGNATQKSVSFQVTTSVTALENLITQFAANGWIDNEGIATDLTAKLSGTKPDLHAFINAVQAQSGKHITTTAATYLLRDANFLLKN